MDRILGVDYRSLTAFRQIIALIYIFFIIVIRIVYFEYYSIEHGPFSNDVMLAITNRPILCNLISSDFQLILFMIVGASFGVLLFLGIYTSFASFISMFFLILFSRRFFPYYYGTDEVVVVCLFALGFVYLINPKKSQINNNISINANPFVLLLLLQVAIIYWFNGLNKTDISWWKGEAVSMAVFNVLFNKPLGIYMQQFPIINTFLTYFTLFFELIFIFLIFSPKYQKLTRIIAAIFIILFHWGIHFFVDVTLYKYTGIAFFFLLMPAEFWQKSPFLSKILIDKNSHISFKLNQNIVKKIAYSVCAFIFMMAVNTSIYYQNNRYKFIQNNKVLDFMQFCKTDSYSPIRQYWFMFAPSPPKNTGYIAFEYVQDTTIDNVNIYGNKMPTKNFCYFHPFHYAIITQYRSFDSGIISKETEFVLLSLFPFIVQKDRYFHLDRLQEYYVISSYRQSYQTFKINNKYKFKRLVIAEYK
jgi:hypothetical protein